MSQLGILAETHLRSIHIEESPKPEGQFYFH
jgi:hypothetical protein